MAGHNSNLILWAESPEEARTFLHRAVRQGFPFKIDQIYVAKRSAKNRSNTYVEGEYFITSNDDAVTVFNDVVVAPRAIIDLVQWCTCDIMISRGEQPLVVLEDTTHIVRMNVYQRVPRLYKAAILGIPAIALQGTRGLDFSKQGDCWGLHRYMRAFAAICEQYPASGVLPFFYVPDTTGDEERAEREAFDYLSSIVGGDQVRAEAIRQRTYAEVFDIASNGYLGYAAPAIPSIEVSATTVIVNVGAKPEKKSWEEKGSGQMDPYIGMIAAAKYMYCFDHHGNQVKEMVVRFNFLPPDFWWFKGWEKSRSLYKTLAFQIADRVEFLG
jgi:hypothetical protein